MIAPDSEPGPRRQPRGPDRPHGHGPSFYFQQMDAPRPQRNWMHIDVWVLHDQAPARIAAATATGGDLLTDRYALAW